MSRRGHRRERARLVDNVAPKLDGSITPEQEAQAIRAAGATPATMSLRGFFPCTRTILEWDGIRWRCACGASGPVRVSNDGIPYVDEEILAHQPGESRS